MLSLTTIEASTVKITIERLVGSKQADGSGCGYGSGDGDGSGYGSGDGSGSGCGYGSGDGDGSGYGSGDGSGSGCGDGSGYGSGDGSGDGSGSGCGYGSGDGSPVETLEGIKMSNLAYVIVRTEKTGCFAGELESQEQDQVILQNARRLWYWDGAASLSQLAVRGTSKPTACKFPIAIPRARIFGVLEILETTKEARKSIEAVPEWSV